MVDPMCVCCIFTNKPDPELIDDMAILHDSLTDSIEMINKCYSFQVYIHAINRIIYIWNYLKFNLGSGVYVDFVLLHTCGHFYVAATNAEFVQLFTWDNCVRSNVGRLFLRIHYNYNYNCQCNGKRGKFSGWSIRFLGEFSALF